MKWVTVKGMSMSTDNGNSPFKKPRKLLKLKRRKFKKGKARKPVSVMGTLKGARALLPEEKKFKWY